MRFLTQLPRRGVVSCSCSCSYYLLFLCRYGETQCYALLLCTYIDTLYIVGSLCPIYNIYIPCHIRYECSTVQFFFFIYIIYFLPWVGLRVAPIIIIIPSVSYFRGGRSGEVLEEEVGWWWTV